MLLPSAPKHERAQQPSTAPVEWHASPVGELHEHIEPASVDAIVTDPPYERAAIPAYRDLATFAVHALKPGGHLVVLCGCSYLPQIYQQQLEVDGLD